MDGNLERLIKQGIPFKSEYIKAELGLLYVSSILSNQNIQYFKRFKLSPQQYNILRILRGQFPKACNINSIRERMLDKMSDVSRIVDRLHKQNLILKELNILDKRNSDITISEKGLELLAKIDSEDNNVLSLIYHLTQAEAKNLNEIIDKILGFQ